MFDDLFDNFGNDPRFMRIIDNMVDKMVIDVNNELKFNRANVNDDVVGATILILFKNNLSFEFMRTLNLCVNAKDEIAYGNVNDFINKVEALYNKGEEMKEEQPKKIGCD